jgi:O-antigen/teichoic acid export membrane protein
VAIVCILVIGRMFAAANGPRQTFVTMVGHERIGALLLVVGAMLNMGGCLLAVRFSETIGLAVVTTPTLIAWNVAMAVFIHRRLGVRPALLPAFLFQKRPTAAQASSLP